MPEIGPHLLGRVPSPPDSRDYELKYFLPEPETLGPVPYLVYLLKRFIAWLEGSKPPAPTPPPEGKFWPNSEPVLDQGNTGHCVGFGGAQWGNTLPIDDHFDNEDGHSLYYICKTYDGEPGQENGSTVRSLAKALKGQGRLNTYAFAGNVDEIIQFVSSQGPVVVGTDWTNDMFEPDSSGLVSLTGDVAGGHCYLLCGYNDLTGEFEFLNSWGEGWGVRGYFYMRVEDFARLLAADGEACAAVELPL